MDTMTGKLYNLTDKQLKDISYNSIKENLIQVNEEDITKKQKEDMQVSIYDNKSILGKLYTELRKKGWGSLTKNQRRNIKKKYKLN
jgi:DNA-directed RNA polymerase delta subunit